MRISDWSSDVCSSDLVPPWPILRGFRTRRTRPTTCVEVRPSGLSMIIQPLTAGACGGALSADTGLAAMRILLRILAAAGFFLGAFVFRHILRHPRMVQDGVDARGLLEGVVGLEGPAGVVTQLQLLAELAAQEAGSVVPRRDHRHRGAAAKQPNS